MSEYTNFKQEDLGALQALSERKPSTASDIRYAGHLKAFVVRGLYELDLVSRIRDEIGKSIKKGTTFDDFKKTLVPTLQRAGFLRRSEQAIATKLHFVYNTVLSSVQNQARARQQYDLDGDIYLRYVGILDQKIRPSHKARDNIILPSHHEFWRTNYPPNGFRCRCKVLAYTKEELEVKGLKVTDEQSHALVNAKKAAREAKGDAPFAYDTRGLTEKSLFDTVRAPIIDREKNLEKTAVARKNRAKISDISRLRDEVELKITKKLLLNHFYAQCEKASATLHHDFKEQKALKDKKERDKYYNAIFKLEDDVGGKPLYISAQTFGKNKDKRKGEDRLDLYLLVKDVLLGRRKIEGPYHEGARDKIYFFKYFGVGYELIVKTTKNNELFIKTLFPPDDFKKEINMYRNRRKKR